MLFNEIRKFVIIIRANKRKLEILRSRVRILRVDLWARIIARICMTQLSHHAVIYYNIGVYLLFYDNNIIYIYVFSSEAKLVGGPALL